MRPFNFLPFVLFVACLSPTPSPSGQVVNYNPGPVIAQDCLPHRLEIWTNQTGREVIIVALDLWMGLYRDAYADLTIEVYRSDDLLVGRYAWDRYANPNGDTNRWLDLGNEDLRVGIKQSLYLNGLNCYVGGVASPMHPTVVIYFK